MLDFASRISLFTTNLILLNFDQPRASFVSHFERRDMLTDAVSNRRKLIGNLSTDVSGLSDERQPEIKFFPFESVLTPSRL